MRHTFLLAGVFALLALFGTAVAQDKPKAEEPANPAPKTEAPAKADPAWDWVFFYYMGYDNNLESCGRPILDMLKKGITSDRVAVITAADFNDTDGMKRYEATKTGEKETKLDTEDAADEATVKQQLEWTRDNYKAAKYAIVFLDHGGALSEMSYDENPGKSKRDWLHAVKVADVISAWRKTLTGKLEYVFIQQCGKGTLENYYAFRNTAPYVMASQTTVGAPNYYYTDALKEICAKPDIDGKQVSHLFQQHETDNMFTTYTTINDKALIALPEKLNAVLKPLLEAKEFKKPAILGERIRRAEKAPEGPSARMCFQGGADESMVDGLALLKALYEANKLEMAAYDAFAKWVKDDLITEHRVSPARETVAGSWCGFSLYVPRTEAALERYKDYPIYKDTTLKELMAKMVK